MDRQKLTLQQNIELTIQSRNDSIIKSCNFMVSKLFHHKGLSTIKISFPSISRRLETTLSSHGGAIVQVGIDTRVELVRDVGAMRTSRSSSASASTSASVAAASHSLATSAVVLVAVHTRVELVADIGVVGSNV